MSRPPAEAPSASATAILDAAEGLFAAQGFERTTIKQIAAKAKVNSALLYYYFDDKPNLYRTVLTRIMARLKTEARQAIAGAPSVETMLTGVVAAQGRMLTAHPRAATLLLREMMDHNAEHAYATFQEIAADLFRPAVAVIEAGQRAGTVRPDLDPRLAAISTLSQLAYFMLALPAIRIFLGKAGDFPGPDDIAAFSRHAGAFAAAAVSRPTNTPASAPAVRRTKKDPAR